MAVSGSTETAKAGFPKILKGVWAFLNSRLFVIGLIVVILLIGLGEYKKIVDLKRKVDQHEQNISALTDSLTFERTKTGELLVSIDGYISSEKELKNLNKELWDEVHVQKGKVLMLTNTIIGIKQDSADLAETVDELNVIIGQLQQAGDKYTAPWVIPHKFSEDNFFTVKGSTVLQVLNKDPFKMRHDTTYLTGFENQIDISYGQKVENNKLRVFIVSEYPGFTVKSMEGVLIDPSEWPSVFKPAKRHWFTGFGVGPNLTMGYDFIGQKPSLVVGVGIQYNIYQW